MFFHFVEEVARNRDIKGGAYSWDSLITVDGVEFDTVFKGHTFRIVEVGRARF